MPQAIFTPMSSGYLQLGHKTPFGVQTSIENFDGFLEAQEWVSKNGVRPKYGFGPHLLRPDEVIALTALIDSGTFGGLSKILGFSLSKAASIFMRLESFGAVAIARAKPRKDSIASLTDTGRAYVSLLQKKAAV